MPRDNKTPNGGLFLGFFMIDVLFMPYLLPIPVPLSGLVLPFWLLNSGLKVEGKVAALCVAGCFFVGLSYLNGQYELVHDPKLYQTRFINAGILIFMFVTYALAHTDANGRLALMKSILSAYLIFSFLLSLLFFLDPNIYFQLRSFWTFSQNEAFFSSLTTLVRYTGILSDPNNMASSTAAVAAALIFLDPKRLFRNIVIIAMTTVITVATMSVTGLISVALLIGAFIFLANFFENLTYNIVMKLIALLATLTAAIGLYFILRDEAVFNLALERINASDIDSRLSRWLIVFDYEKIVSSIWLGDGGSIFWQGRDYRPHNGHLYVIFSFGIFAYLIFISLFFRYMKALTLGNAVFLVVMFICFTVNVGVYEHRFAGIWVILMAMYHEAGRVRQTAHA